MSKKHYQTSKSSYLYFSIEIHLSKTTFLFFDIKKQSWGVCQYIWLRTDTDLWFSSHVHLIWRNDQLTNIPRCCKKCIETTGWTFDKGALSSWNLDSGEDQIPAFVPRTLVLRTHAFQEIDPTLGLQLPIIPLVKQSGV